MVESCNAENDLWLALWLRFAKRHMTYKWCMVEICHDSWLVVDIYIAKSGLWWRFAYVLSLLTSRVRRLMMGSPLPALLVDRVASVSVISAWGGHRVTVGGKFDESARLGQAF